MSKEAMKLALKALEGVWKGGFSFPHVDCIRKAITALREALAEPSLTACFVKKIESLIAERDALIAKLAEQPAQQEPVAWVTKEDVKFFNTSIQGEGAFLYMKNGKWNIPLFISQQPPVQRTWVGLTQDEFRDFASTLDYGTGGLIRAIEAKLKEKNT